MNPRIKRLLSMLLALTMVFSLTTPVSASAASTTAASSNTVEVEVGETAKLKVSGIYSKTTWTSSDEAVATVSSNGTVTGVAPGTATITAVSKSYFSFWGGNKTTKFTVIVTEPEEALTVKAGETLQLEIETTGGTVTWKSSNKSIATVDANGLVTGVSEGDVTITATEKKTTGGNGFWFFWWGSGKTTTTVTEFEVTVLPGDEQPTEPEVPTEPTEPEVPTEPEIPTEPEVTTYTVSFESNGGSTVEAQIVVEGETAVEPEAPTMEGYTFTGWYSDAELTTAYDFATPVTVDITLYANWEADTITEDELNTDGDSDGLSDGAEDFLGTDKDTDDTDGDGLSDADEVIIGSNPTIADTDGDEVIDSDEDADSDKLTNLHELEIGTDPVESDSDHDGLNDYDEIYTYNTQPLNKDTDGDDALDGWEIAKGFDPLTANSSFTVTTGSSTNDIRADVELQVSGNQVMSLIVEEAVHIPFLDDTIPGYIGAPFNFSVGGTFDKAVISFTFDGSLLSDPTFAPTIYYYNEETQCLEELPTTLEGNVASTTVTHFSTYILLNKTAFDLVWASEIKPPITSEDGTSSNIDVVFVIDCSGSMSSYNRMSTAKSALHTFIGALGEEDRAALVKFTSTASVMSSLTTDKASVDALVDGLSASGQTAMYKGLEEGINLLSTENEVYGYKMIIVLSDGTDEPSTTYSGHYASLVESAVANNIVVYTIGAGTSVNTSILTQVAVNTGGSYYAATETSGITDAFTEIKGDTVDLTTDSNSDGISDYFTELLCNGSLKLGTGKNNPFFLAGVSFEDVQFDTDGDFDNDGLLNGQELIVKYIESLKRVYVWFMSDPTSADSDYDGIDDTKEEDQAAAHNNQFEATVSYISGGNTYNFDAEFVVDYSLFFGDNTKYSQDLAVLASLYALDMYEEKTIGGKESYGYLAMTSGTSGTTKGSNGIAFGEIFGLHDCVNIDETELASTYASLDSNGNLVDQDDVAEAFFGHRLVSYNGEQREIIFLAVRGTNGTQDEWSSNFDIGADTDDYYNKTGEHPDWKNKQNHKGFDVTATRIIKAFTEYIRGLESAGKMNPEIERSIFITGHSRGAGIANLLGAHFEKQTGYHSFVYTMASPYTTTDSNAASSYHTIFNIRNEDDLVTYLPLADWGFYKYGETLSVSVENDGYEDSDPFGDAQGTFEELFGKDYNSNSYVDDAEAAFLKLTSGRDAYYVLDYTSGDGQVVDGALRFGNSEDKFKKMLNAGKLLNLPHDYCIVKRNDQIAGYTLGVTYCPAYAAQIIANLASTDEIKERYPDYGRTTWIGIDLKGVYSNARTTFALASGKISVAGVGPGGMECPHIPGSYYLIASNTSYSKYEKS